MPAGALLLLALGLAAGASQAGEAPQAPPPIAAELEYADRLLAMEDTAAAHVDLARWCEASGLTGKAKVHWREALVRESDNAQARAALRFVRRGSEWVPADQAEPAATQKPQPPDPTFFERRRELNQEVMDVARTLLIPSDPERWKKGAIRILMIHDPAGAEPIARLLGIGGVEMRSLACQALAGIPGDEPTSFLLGFLLADESDDVRRAALDGLRHRVDERVINQLIYVLARGREATMQRAAYALGDLRVEEAVPALIANLRTVEYRTVYVKELRVPPPITGSAIAYVADVRPVVAPGVVAYDPVIGYITPEGIRIPEYERPVVVTVPRTQARLIPQPAVLEALKKITGRDFAYDQARWRGWYALAVRGRAAEPAVEPAPPGAGAE